MHFVCHLGEVEKSPHVEKVGRRGSCEEPTVVSSILNVRTGKPQDAIECDWDYHHIQWRQ